jgi:multiple sugar transport system substrate-binding protein
MSLDQAGNRSIKDAILARASRRALLRGGAGVGIGMGLGAGFARTTGAQDATPAAAAENPFPPYELPRFEGEQLNFMIIQPHAVTGDILKARFEELTGATVNVTVVPYDEVQAKATLDVQSGANQFDVFDYWYPTVGALASQGILDDLTEFIDGDAAIDAADFIPSIYDVYTEYDGRRWGLPYDGDTHVLFYNTEIFEQAGVEAAPETWDEFLAAAQTITEAGLTTADGKPIYGCALQAFKAPIIIGSTYSNRLAGFGGAYLSEDGQPALDSEAAVQAAQALLDVAPFALPTPLETAFDQALPAFLSGQIAMMDFWTDLGVYAQDPEGSQIVDKWDVVQMPYGGANTAHVAPLNAGFCFSVSANARNKDLARAFCAWATSKQMNLDLLLVTGSGIDPNRVSTLESEAYKAFAPKVQAAAAASLSGAFAWPTITQSPELMTVLSDELALMLQGNQDAATTMGNVQTAWTGILGG